MREPFRVLDLFSGIGGFSLGLERAGGFRAVAFCEIEPYARSVLAERWPGVPVYGDVRELTAARLAADGIRADVVCGGFPCQDISSAGRRAGLSGLKSGLWSEYARLVGEIRPRYVIVENVADLLHRGLGEVLGDLAALGYDAEWHCIPATYVGAAHRRDRIWIVAHPDERRLRGISDDAGDGRALPPQGPERQFHRSDGWPTVADTDCQQTIGAAIARQERNPWPAEPAVDRVAHGLPARVDRLRALGNAVVPQIPELIGRAILKTEQFRKRTEP